MSDKTPGHSGLGWASTAIAVAALGLAIGNADSTRNWAEGLKPNPVNQPVREAAERWAGLTKAARLSLARDEVRGLWERRHEIGWTGVAGQRQTLAPPV
jgi:hypothetical protein